MSRNNTLKRKLYNQKKFLLLNVYALSLMASSINVEAKNVAGISKVIEESFEEKNLSHYAGISKEIAEMLKENLENKPTIHVKAKEGSRNKDSQKIEEEQRIEQKEIVEEKQETIYYDVPCENALQDFIFEMDKEYQVPSEIMVTIIDRESGGTWTTNGVISSTNDYGLTQVNECNAEYIKKKLGYSMEDILHDPYKAIEAQALLLQNIMKLYGYDRNNFDYENIFGTYNGWINWREKEMAVDYAEGCMEILNEKILGERKLN